MGSIGSLDAVFEVVRIAGKATAQELGALCRRDRSLWG